jgi:cytochrome c5
LRDQDQQFFDSFMLVLGILIGVAVGLFFLVRMIAIDTQGQYVLSDPTVQAEIEQRITPVGHVLLLGDEELAAAAAAATAPARVEATLSGPQVYNEACYLCHAAPGVGGAPVIGNVEAWGPRIEKGMDVLTEHALNGFQGDSGFMPAKGGRVDLSDGEIVSAIEYMVGQAQANQ